MPIQATTTPGSSAVLPATAVTGMPSAIEPMATPICPGTGYVVVLLLRQPLVDPRVDLGGDPLHERVDQLLVVPLRQLAAGGDQRLDLVPRHRILTAGVAHRSPSQ